MNPTPRQQLAVFLSATFVLSYLCEWYMIKSTGAGYAVAMFLLMWIPGLIGIACSHVFKHNFRRDMGWFRPLEKYWIMAYAVPAGAVTLMLLISVEAGLGIFNIENDRSAVRLFLFTPTLGVLISMLATVGEELGWRGFLQSRALEAKVRFPYIWIGLIWAVWHWPLVLFSGESGSKLPLLSLFLFTISIMSFGIFLGWLRTRSHSLWPPVMAHAVHNTWIHSIYPGVYKGGTLSPYFGGESGFLLAILYLFVAIYVLRQVEKFLQ